MKLITGYMMEREMTRGGRENYFLSVIHPPGMEGNYAKQIIRDLLQSREQEDELVAVDGYFRSWIPAHEPIGGEPV